MWSFHKKQEAKKVNEEEQEENLTLQETITIYSRSRQIIGGKCVIKSYVDSRDLENMMKLICKGIRFNLKVATKFDNIKVHSITLHSSNEFLISKDSPKSQYGQAGQKCAKVYWSENE